MCSGAVMLYKIPRLVIGESVNFKGDEDLLRSRGVEVIVLDDANCKELMRKFISEKPEVCMLHSTLSCLPARFPQGPLVANIPDAGVV